MSADPRVPEHVPLTFGIMGINLKNSAVEKFARDMAENIIRSISSQIGMEEPETDVWALGFNPTQEVFAEGLASAVMEVALNEAGLNTEDRLEKPCSSTSGRVHPPVPVQRQSNVDLLLVDSGVDPSKDLHPLPQSGLPLLGSLEYPDAPPTTPLLPELETSKYSFSRKLKGGLAKVFPPSPPPPTPKDTEEGPEGTPMDSRVALMQHLMHSLPADDLASDCTEEGPRRHGAQLEAFAEALSRDLIDWLLSSKQPAAERSDLHLLAQQMVEAIIASSFDEARMLL